MAAPRTPRTPETIPVALTVGTNTAGYPIWYATWRDSSLRPMYRTVGRAHLRRRARRRNPRKPREQGLPLTITYEERRRALETAGFKRRERWRVVWEAAPGRAKAGTYDLRAAQARAREMVHEREAEIENLRRMFDGSPKTFGRIADLWLEERWADVADGHAKRSTVDDYASMLRRASDPMKTRGRGRTAWIMAEFDARPVAEIAGAELDAWLRKLREQGRTSATRDKYRRVTSMIFDYAVAEGWLEENPWKRARRRKRSKAKPQIRVYEIERVEEIAREIENPLLADMVRLAALTGLRQGELRALAWGDLDFPGQRITVARSGPQETTPKGGQARTVPMSDPALVLLDGLSKRDEWTRKGDLVFTMTGEPLADTTVRRAYERARNHVLARAETRGESLPRCRFHDLRHVFGTRCAMRNIPLATIKAWMGHSSISTTMVYVHSYPQADDAAKLTAAFASATTSGQLLEDVGE